VAGLRSIGTNRLKSPYQLVLTDWNTSNLYPVFSKSECYPHRKRKIKTDGEESISSFKHTPRRSIELDPSLMDHDKSTGADGFVRRLGDQDDGHSIPVEIVKQGEDFMPCMGIEERSRFVKDQIGGMHRHD
jgi:hypothetical protein